MKKFLCLLLALALLCAVTACGTPESAETPPAESSAAPPSETPVPSSEPENEASPEPSAQEVSHLTEETDEIIVGAVYPEALEGLVVSQDILDSEGYGILIRAKEPLTDFVFFTVETTYPYTGGVDYIEGDRLNSFDEVDETHPVVLYVRTLGEHALFGFRFTDADGEEHRYALSAGESAESAPYHIAEF